MQRVFTHPNYLVVQTARALLEGAGLDVFVRHEHLLAGFGELSGIDTWPELWVRHPSQTARARAVLAEWNAGIPTGSAWRCPACGAEVEAEFNGCWQCGQLRPLPDDA